MFVTDAKPRLDGNVSVIKLDRLRGVAHNMRVQVEMKCLVGAGILLDPLQRDVRGDT